MVFPESIEGTKGLVNTLTGKAGVIAFPVGFSTLMYSEYTFPINDICELPVLLIVNWKLVADDVLGTPEFPYVIPSVEYK